MGCQIEELGSSILESSAPKLPENKLSSTFAPGFIKVTPPNRRTPTPKLPGRERRYTSPRLRLRPLWFKQTSSQAKLPHNAKLLYVQDEDRKQFKHQPKVTFLFLRTRHFDPATFGVSI
jgi:ribosomal protein S30